MKTRVPRPAPPSRTPARSRPQIPSLETKPAPEPADPEELVQRAERLGHHFSQMAPSPQPVVQRVRNGNLEPKDIKKLDTWDSAEDIEEFFKDEGVNEYWQRKYRSQRKDLFSPAPSAPLNPKGTVTPPPRPALHSTPALKPGNLPPRRVGLSRPFVPPSRITIDNSDTTTTTRAPEPSSLSKRSRSDSEATSKGLSEEAKLRLRELRETPLSERIQAALDAQIGIDEEKGSRKEKHQGVSSRQGQAFKAIAGNEEEQFLSGYRDRSQDRGSQSSRARAERGYGEQNIPKVKALAEKIGFEGTDNETLSHAEKQFAAAHPNKPFANSQPMCRGWGQTQKDCQGFFGLLAAHPEHLTQVASEPGGIRVFLPGGEQRKLNPQAEDFDEQVAALAEEEQKLLEAREESEPAEKKRKKGAEEKDEDSEEEEEGFSG